MKRVPVLLLCMSLSAFAAHATDDNPLDDPLFSATGVPFTTIEGVEEVPPESYEEIYHEFLNPIYSSDFCMVIDRIVIKCGVEETQWKVDMYLKTGEHISRHKIYSFHDSDVGTKPRYAQSLKSIFRELEGIIRTDPKLKKFFREEFPHHRAASESPFNLCESSSSPYELQ